MSTSTLIPERFAKSDSACRIGNTKRKYNENEQHKDNYRIPNRYQHHRRNGGHGTKHAYSKSTNINNEKVVPIMCSVCCIVEPKYKCPKCRSTYCSIICCRRHKEEFCSIGIVTTDTSVNVNDRPQDGISSNHQKSKYLSQSEIVKYQRENIALPELQQKLSNENVDDEDDFDAGWKITDEMIQRMKHSSWLRDELADTGLQQLISKILSSSNDIIRTSSKQHRATQLDVTNVTTHRESTLSALKLAYPQFQTFIDKLLCLTEIYDREPRDPNKEIIPLNEWLTQQNNSLEYNSYNLFLKPLPRRKLRVVDHDPCKLSESNESDTSDSASDNE